MEVYLIRHTTPLIDKGLVYGRLDVPLTDTFLVERKQVIEQLPDDIEVVYSSPSSRCSQLAAFISPFYMEDKALHELNFGDWEGRTWDTIDRVTSTIWMNDFVNLAPPAGETMLEMQHRVMEFWNGLLELPYRKSAIVTHGGVIRIILAHYRKIALKDAFTIKVELAEVIKLNCV